LKRPITADLKIVGPNKPLKPLQKFTFMENKKMLFMINSNPHTHPFCNTPGQRNVIDLTEKIPIGMKLL